MDQQQNNIFVPLVNDDGLKFNSTVIDAALAKKLDVEGLKKMKAIEYTIQFMDGKSGKSDPESIEKIIKLFYKQLNNERNN